MEEGDEVKEEMDKQRETNVSQPLFIYFSYIYSPFFPKKQKVTTEKQN